MRAVFSVLAPSRPRANVRTLSLEQLTGRRVDLDVHDIDNELGTSATVELRRAVLRALSRRSVVFTYRPSTFLSAICFARQDTCTYAGLFKDHQAAFEHKPWVESSLRALGIPTIPWTYVADEDQLDALDYLVDGPVVLRTSRSSGGAGLTKLDSGADLQQAWPRQAELFASVAPYIAGGTPANVSGVVWREGVTLHGASVQLIGVPECTRRPFGYCGNDFGAAKQLDPTAVDEMDERTRQIGQWLQSFGFLGAFGVDYLVTEAGPLFTEINPRFQGVTHLSCQLAAARNQSCVMLEHLAALLGVEAPLSDPLRQQLSDVPEVAHVVLHWPDERPGRVDTGLVQDLAMAWPEVKRTDVICPEGVTVDAGATIIRLTVHDRLTRTGFELLEPWRSRMSEAVATARRGET